MRLEKRGIRPRLRAADAVPHETEKSGMFFDPRVDFDQEVKQSVLADLAVPNSLTPDRAKVQFFYALFPREFTGLQDSHVAEDMNGFIKETNEYPIHKLRVAERFALLFPGQARDLAPYLDKGYVQIQLAAGPKQHYVYIECLFLRELIFGEKALSPERAEQEWKNGVAAVDLLKRDKPIVEWFKHMAFLRLVFPEKNVSALLSAQDIKKLKEVMKTLSVRKDAGYARSKKFGNVYDGSREQYAELAWAATILSAQTVGISAGGVIEFELAKQSAHVKHPLPERAGV